MSERPFYAPGPPPPIPARQPRPTEHVWTMRKGSDVQTAEFLAQPGGAIELQLFSNGSWIFSRRHENRELAITEADEERARLDSEGWQRDSSGQPSAVAPNGDGSQGRSQA